MNKQKIFFILAVIVLSFLISPFWYSFLRYQKIVHNESCGKTTAPCVYEIIPPSLWEMITNKSSLEMRPPCDQSATTTDCSKIITNSSAPTIVATTSANPVQSGKIDEHLTISIGDKLGGMIVTEVSPFNSGQYSTHPEMMKFGPQNAKVILRGPIVVTGTYGLVDSAIGFSGYCMSKFDSVSLTQLPYLPVKDSKPSIIFCFRNGKFAQQKLGEAERTISVKIDNYELNSYPSEVMDYADLVEVLTN